MAKRFFWTGVTLLTLLLAFSAWEAITDNFIVNYAYIHNTIVEWIPKLFILLFIVIAAKATSMLSDIALKRYFKYVGKEQEYFSFGYIARYIIWLVAILGMLSVIIGNLGVWLTSVGLIGFGITFALQKPILNFVGWLTVILTENYSVGDRIKVGNHKGDVIEIQMMYTVVDGLLEDSDELSGKIITFPNAEVLTSPITNYTKNGEYIWDDLTIDITYESNWKKAKTLLKEIASEVVDNYVKEEKSGAKKEKVSETLALLKLRHRLAKRKEKEMIEKRMNEISEQKDRIESGRDVALIKIKKEPSIRVNLRDSSIGLTVRYLAHYTDLKIMKSEINSGFLKKTKKIKDIEIAYPHLQIVK